MLFILFSILHKTESHTPSILPFNLHSRVNFQWLVVIKTKLLPCDIVRIQLMFCWLLPAFLFLLQFCASSPVHSQILNTVPFYPHTPKVEGNFLPLRQKNIDRTFHNPTYNTMNHHKKKLGLLNNKYCKKKKKLSRESRITVKSRS